MVTKGFRKRTKIYLKKISFFFSAVVVLRKNIIKMNQLQIYNRQMFNVISDFCLIECCSILFAISVTLALSVRRSISEMPKLHYVSDSFGCRSRSFDSNLIIFRCRCVCFVCVSVYMRHGFQFPSAYPERLSWKEASLNRSSFFAHVYLLLTNNNTTLLKGKGIQTKSHCVNIF